MNRRMIPLAASIGVGLLVGHGLPAHAQTEPAALAGYQGADREHRLREGAKKEGELTLYSSMQMESIAPLQKAFEDKYGVKIKIWRASGNDILVRAGTEAKANRTFFDVAESDGFALEALARDGLLQEVKSPYLADLIAEAIRPHSQWVGTRVNIFSGVYNTNQVRPEALPKSYQDLLDPRFKGMLGIETDDYDWFGMIVELLGEENGLRLFRDIVATNGFSVRKGHTLLTNLTAAGEVPIGLTVFLQNVSVAKKAGAPVESFLLPPTVARANGIAVARRAPHPHAAMLFYDFMLSEGQQLMLGREFIPTSKKVSSALDGIKLHFVDAEIVLDGRAKWQRLYADVLRGAR
jgi:ABC-type Fe3+ transport system substrate-binding protein